MTDITENTRRQLVHIINTSLPEDEAERRAILTEAYGAENVFDTDEVSERFSIEGFMAPYCSAIRKSTGERVLLSFCHSPRFYWIEKG